jgi:hypothetical protein
MARKWKVKPCPCCDSAKVHVGPMSAMSYGVICRDCGVRAESHVFDSDNDDDGTEAVRRAVKTWNVRKREEELKEEIEDLEEIIENLEEQSEYT